MDAVPNLMVEYINKGFYFIFYLGYTRYIPPLGIYMVYTWYIPTIYLVGVPDELQTQCVLYVVFTRQSSEALKYFL